MRRTVRLVIVGNEVLSGKVADKNTPFVIERLRAIGARCLGVEVVRDEVEEIAGAVRRGLSAADFVITSGGIGPTHDDVTIEGVARALGRDVVVHEPLLAALHALLGQPLSDRKRRMARAPAGAELLPGEGFPQVRAGNVLIFPGVPELLRMKFKAVEPLLRGEPLPCAAVYSALGESAIAAALERTEAECPGIAIGSYPRWEPGDHRVLVTIDGETRAAVDVGLDRLLGALPEGAVVRVVREWEPEGR
jgi:molybdenum cofactor synthesis domain-containing protein